jgi:Transglycosylase
MVMLLRTVTRLLDGERPLYPRRQPVPMARISPHLRLAVLAAEDARFYHHFGFDFHEIARALDDYDQGKDLRGASTITQQTAKNLFLWDGRSWLRKGLEAYLAVVLETVLPKNRILEISYGQNIRTCLPTRGYASTIAGALACLPLHSHPYSASIGTVKAEGGGDGLETPAGVYHWDHRSGTAVTQ